MEPKIVCGYAVAVWEGLFLWFAIFPYGTGWRVAALKVLAFGVAALPEVARHECFRSDVGDWDSIGKTKREA